MALEAFSNFKYFWMMLSLDGGVASGSACMDEHINSFSNFSGGFLKILSL